MLTPKTTIIKNVIFILLFVQSKLLDYNIHVEGER